MAGHEEEQLRLGTVKAIGEGTASVAVEGSGLKGSCKGVEA
jgi:hypothetical protein